jgi:alanyl-tRNA synthetase
VFKLYDTFGFPMDLTADIARERGLLVDEEGFERAMQAQRERARGASHFAAEQYGDAGIDTPTVFTGYEALAGEARVLALLRDGQRVEASPRARKASWCWTARRSTPSPAARPAMPGVIEAGGWRFEVRDTTKAGAISLHHGVMARGTLAVGAVTPMRAWSPASARPRR